MKVLFVISGYSKGTASPVVISQAKSISEQGIFISFFFIKGKGIKGYTKASFRLRKHLKNNQYDVVHAHYSLSGYAAALSGASPLVVSLMGSDVYGKPIKISLLKFFIKRFWNKTIVKTRKMAETVDSEVVSIIPNGVNLDRFYPENKEKAKKKIGLSINEKYILFAANPGRPEKNFELAQKSFELIDDNRYKLICLENIPHSSIVNYMNSSEVIILSSFREGSPNVIKEAMACNKPIVSTNVGDVEWLLENCNGCFISDHNVSNYSNSLKLALSFAQKEEETNGREKLLDLSLEDKQVAKRIINIYQSIQ